MIKSLRDELAIYNDVANLCLSENAPEQMAAHKRYETALYSHGVYEAAAQGLAYVNREAATATGSHLEVLEAARSMIHSYSTETFKALAKAKTFKEREIIRKKATDDATAKKEAEQAERNANAERKHKERLAEEARKKAENAEAVELDRKYKEATIRLADNFGNAATTTPPKKAERANRREPYNSTYQKKFADMWNAETLSINKPPLVRNFLEKHKEALATWGVKTTAEVKRIKDAARKAGLINKRNRRKSSGKSRQV